jgi:AraC-like DNA-binding protein
LNADALIRFDFHTGGWVTLPPGSTFGPRRLKDCELLWILEGDVKARIDGRAFDLFPGSIILSRQGMTDCYEWDPKRGTRAVYLHFSFEHARAPGMSKQTSLLPPQEAWPLARHMPEGDIVRPLFKHLMWLLDHNQPRHKALAQGIARQLLLAFVTGEFHSSAQTASDLPDPVRRVFRFIHERVNSGRATHSACEPPTLADMADVALISEGHLCRVFKQVVGCSPMKAARLIRVDRAATMLAESNLRVNEVSILAGFENAFHFSRCFREAFGISPSAYRTKAAQGLVSPHSRLRTLRLLSGPF